LTGLLATNGQLQSDWSADYRLYSRQRIDAARPARSAGLAFLKRYPSRMGRSTKCWQSPRRIRDQKQSVSIVPYAGTEVSLRLISQHFVLGYFH